MTRSAIAVVLAVGALCTVARAEQSPRKEFYRLVQQRNQLHTQLEQLDRQAAEALTAGREAATVHAEQMSVQDRLDLLQLRLETLAMRHEFALPPLPQPAGARAGEAEGPAGNEFERGRQRTLPLLRDRTLRMLRQIDYSGFLAGGPS